MASDDQVLTAIQTAIASTIQAMMRDGGTPGRRGHDDALEKLTKKLDSFNGTGFADWKFKLQMAMQSFSSEAHQFLGWAENLGAEIDSDVDITDDQKPLCERLYFVLAQMTTGEAFDLVRNAPELNGAEAWRRLCKRYGGKTTGKRVHLTRRCVNPPKVKKLAEALSMVEKWESCDAVSPWTTRRR